MQELTTNKQPFYPAGWTWVRRYTETDEATGEVREVDEATALIGWVFVDDPDTGGFDYVGVTAGGEGQDPVIPAPDAEGFVRYEQPKLDKNGRPLAKTGDRLKVRVITPGTRPEPDPDDDWSFLR